jgi:hypothetical protein
MSRVLALLLTAVLFAVASPARAFTPESGWWIATGEPGYGFSIEIQDNFLFMVAFTYDANDPRPPRWVAAEGLMANNATFSAPLYSRAGGTCVGCPFRQPGPTVAIGSNMAISFETETTATLTWAGRTIDIERFDFYLSRNPAVRPKTELWLGEWQVVMDFSPIPQARPFPYFGEVLIFDFPFDGAGGQIPNNTTVVEGCRPETSLAGVCSNTALANHEAAVSYSISDGTNFIVVEEDANTWFAYEVTVGTNQFDGIMKRCPRSIPENQLVSQCIDNNTTYPQLPVRGWRSASRAFIRGDDNAPSAIASANAGEGAPAVAARPWSEWPLQVDNASAPAPRVRPDPAASAAVMAGVVESIRLRKAARAAR